MKKICYLILTLFSLSCSTDSNESVNPEEINSRYFKLIVDNDNIELLNDSSLGNVDIRVTKNVISINAQVYFGPTLNLLFDKNGNFCKGELLFGGFSNYKNYINFPSNYFECELIKLDEVNKIIKIKFKGKLYADGLNLNSYLREIEGDVNSTFIYLDEETPINFDSYPYYDNIFKNRYCKAKINNFDWNAFFIDSNLTYTESNFTSYDEYKFIINIASNSEIGSQSFTNSSTGNYIKFYKFNPQTLVFDEYIVNGTINCTYREFHGATYYSNFGTFSFTATNPSNPSDMINVTDGSFRNYQQY